MTNAPDLEPTKAARALDRRKLLAGAAAAGGVAWAAPTILSSSTAHAAGTPGPGCYRFAYAWECGPDGNSCGQISGGLIADPSNYACCPPAGCNPDWDCLPDAPAGCIVVTAQGLDGDDCGDSRTGSVTCSSTTPGDSFCVTLTASCADCYIVSPGVRYRNDGNACYSSPDNSEDVQGGSILLNSVEYCFKGGSNTFPGAFFCYVYCGSVPSATGSCSISSLSCKIL